MHFGARGSIIGAHADHRTTDYFFPRVQSLELRDVPWERRLKPVRSYSQMATYAAVLALAVSVTFAFI
jgi:hypothetical protein